MNYECLEGLSGAGNALGKAISSEPLVSREGASRSKYVPANPSVAKHIPEVGGSNMQRSIGDPFDCIAIHDKRVMPKGRAEQEAAKRRPPL